MVGMRPFSVPSNDTSIRPGHSLNSLVERGSVGPQSHAAQSVVAVPRWWRRWVFAVGFCRRPSVHVVSAGGPLCLCS